MRIASRTGFGQDFVEDFVKCFAREVTYFLRTEGRFRPRAAVVDHVSQCLVGADIVIAHSLGSVVAYEALWKNRIEVPLLITVGSPLAFPRIVFPKLAPPPVGGRGRRPPGVRCWANIADVGDIVATPPGGISRQFHGVDYDRQDSIARFDFHRMANYLRCRELGVLLQRWAKAEQPFSP
jgi:pimeloyl-ACP methyl ester carboxylesterase